MKRILILSLLAASLCSAQNTVVVSKGRTDGGSGIGGFPELDTPIFSALLNEGTGNPAYTGTDSSGTGTCGTLTWNAGPPVSGDGNGTDTDCSMGTGVTNLMPVTFSACIDPDGWGENAAGYIFSVSTAGAVLSTSFFIADAADTIGGFVRATGGDGQRRWDGAGMTIGTGWKHVAVSISNCSTLGAGCVGQAWIDGSPVTTTPSGTSTGTKFADDGTRKIFNRDDDARTFDGRINRIKIYGIAATDAQAAELSLRANCGGGS